MKAAQMLSDKSCVACERLFVWIVNAAVNEQPLTMSDIAGMIGTAAARAAKGA
jgi:hypothetical protein